MEGLGADSEEKREPGDDIDTALVDSLKALDPNRPIRDADMLTPPLGANTGSGRSSLNHLVRTCGQSYWHITPRLKSCVLPGRTDYCFRATARMRPTRVSTSLSTFAELERVSAR